MSRPDSERPILPSILDRLIDEAPEQAREAPTTSHQFLRDLRQSVRRDIENLLNTRQRFVAAPEGAGELALSVYAYGVPDVAGANLSSKRRRAELLRTLEGVIKSHEPRFKSVKLSAQLDEDPLGRSLHFKIDALVHAEPAPEPVQLDSRVEPVSRAFQVRI
jgi:type VI secretion system protein ImpF